MEKEISMDTEFDKIISLYKKLLQIAEEEEKVIGERDLDKLYRYCVNKTHLIETLNKFNIEESLASYPEYRDELDLLIKKIMFINKANAEAVRNIKKDMLKEISSLHNGNRVFRAYQSG